MTAKPDDVAALSPDERRRLLERLLREKHGESRFHSLAEGQRLMWFADQLDPSAPQFHFPMTLRIHGEAPVESLERALEALAQRHESLRTTFRFTGKEPVAQTPGKASFRLEVVETSADDEGLRREVAERAAKPMSLADGPLFQAVLFRRSSDAVLLLLWHHIIFDGWSASVFLTELAVLHHFLSQRLSVDLPAVKKQFSDFVAWQREFLESEEGARSAEYWRRRIRDDLEPLSLPTDRPRQSSWSGSSTGAIHQTFGAELSARLRRLAQEEGATLYAVMLTGLQVLLHRYSGQREISLQSAFAGRPGTEFFGTVGYFVQLLLLTGRIEPGDTFRDVLARAAQDAKEAFAHQHYPISKAVGSMESMKQGGLFHFSRLMFVLQQPRSNEDGTESDDLLRAKQSEQIADFGGMRISGFPIPPPGTPFDLDIEGVEYKNQLSAAFLFNEDVFDKRSVERIADQWIKTLGRMAEDLDAPIDSVAWLEAGEARSLLAQAAGPDAKPWPGGIPELFERRVDEAPDADAAFEDERTITYGEFDRDANRLARRLTALGVGRGDLVGVHLPRSIDSLTALLAVLKTGAAYVPLDPHYPAARLGLVIEDCALPVIVTRSDVAGALPPHRAQLVALDADSETIGALSGERLGAEIGPDDRIHVLHTSGSSGRPKGVEGLHGATVNRLQWMWDAYPFGADEVCCANTPLSFIDSVWEIFGPLLAGVPVLMIDHETARDVDELTDVLADREVTRLVVGPGQLKVFLEHPLPLAQRLPLLKSWTVSGEALPADLAARFLESAPEALLLNLYGCSECAGDSTYHEIRAGWSRPRAPIGRPIAGTSVYVLDPGGRPVPPGVAGEIYIAGVGLARGYLGRDDLTAERFVPNPFSDEPGARMFRTGDLGRVAPDGEIEYLGRGDGQVQIRGCRVEIGEVEAALRASDAVKEAAVLARTKGGETRLTAYVAAQGDAAPDRALLRRHVLGLLPDYMAPADYVFLDALPRTPNGKLNRRALSPAEDAAAARDYVPPATDLERVVCAVLCDVLDVERVGLSDGFFALGGHSLTAARAGARLHRVLKVQIPVRWFFEAPTAGDLTTRIAGSPEGPRAEEAAAATLAAAEASDSD